MYTPAAAAALLRRYADFHVEPTYKGPLVVPHKLSRSMSNSRRSGTRRHHRPKTYGGDGEYETWEAAGYTQEMFDAAAVVREIGTGAFGKVYTIRLPDGRIVVRKDVNYKYIDRCRFEKMIKNEAAALKELSEAVSIRDHISPLIGYKLRKHSEDDDIEYGLFTSSFYMEFMRGMELFDYINKFYTERKVLDDSFIVAINNDIAETLRKMHAKNWFHRDISPENIFMILDEHGNFVRPVVIDFGLACKNVGEGCMLPLGGKVAYMNDAYKAAARGKARVPYKAEYDFGSLDKTMAAWRQMNDYLKAIIATAPVQTPAPVATAVAVPAPVSVAAQTAAAGPVGMGLSIKKPKNHGGRRTVTRKRRCGL